MLKTPVRTYPGELAGRTLNLRRFVNATLLIIFSFFLCLSAFAQFETASVLGFVHDTSGAAIAGSKVTLTNTATGISTTVTTDAQGQFEFASVRVGLYKIQGEASGFSSTATEPFTVEVNARQRVDVTLNAGAVTDSVTVTGTASLLESESSERGQIISPREVTNLPLNGRAYADRRCWLRVCGGITWKTSRSRAAMLPIK